MKAGSFRSSEFPIMLTFIYDLYLLPPSSLKIRLGGMPSLRYFHLRGGDAPSRFQNPELPLARWGETWESGYSGNSLSRSNVKFKLSAL